MALDIKKFCRQIALPEVGMSGQQHLANSHVVVIGLGGLGATASLLVAGSGIGELSLVDGDSVELSNLPRQITHNYASLGKLKVESAAQVIRQRHPDIRLNTVAEPFKSEVAQDLLATADCVLDCTDNFATRYAINRACLSARLPFVSAAAIRMVGQLTTFDFRSFDDNKVDTPCYACLYSEPEASTNEMSEQETCWEQGVLTPLPSIMASLQSLEAVKTLLEDGSIQDSLLIGRLLLFDGLSSQFRETRYQRDPECSVCSAG